MRSFFSKACCVRRRADFFTRMESSHLLFKRQRLAFIRKGRFVQPQLLVLKRKRSARPYLSLFILFSVYTYKPADMLVRRTRHASRSIVMSLCAMAPSFLRTFAAKSSSSYRLRQVQVIHRHGDRSPITPMKDEPYWASLLIPSDVLSKVAQGTTIVRDPNVQNTHVAGGRGPFGKLTGLGLLQMVQVGSTLRERFVALAKNDDDFTTNNSESSTAAAHPHR